MDRLRGPPLPARIPLAMFSAKLWRDELTIPLHGS